MRVVSAFDESPSSTLNHGTSYATPTDGNGSTPSIIRNSG